MSKNKLPLDETKIKISISISRKLNNILISLTHNKSEYIENLLSKHLINEK